MLNERIPVEIRRYKLIVEMEGLTQLEVTALAQTVADRLEDVERRTGIVDTYKLALHACMDLAAEINRLQNQREDQRRMEEAKLDGMITGLTNALESR